MKHAALLIACALPLAACNKSPQVHEKNASVTEVAKRVRESGADQSMVRPGLWQSKVTIEQMEIPGVPPETQQRMKTMMAENQPHGFETCLTPEDVKQPKEDFFAGKNNECRYDRFSMGGGKIDAVMRCGEKSGENQVMQLAGTYSPDAYQMQMSTKAEGRPDGGMSMKMRVEAKRVGECPAKSS